MFAPRVVGSEAPFALLTVVYLSSFYFSTVPRGAWGLSFLARH